MLLTIAQLFRSSRGDPGTLAEKIGTTRSWVSYFAQPLPGVRRIETT
jgi:hypothetical protein